MAFSVEISDRAFDDLEQSIAYIAARSRVSASRWYQAIRTAIASLQHNPDRCPQAREAEWYGQSLRELLHGKRSNTYRILFEVRGSVVYILRIRYSRQDGLKPDEIR